MRKARSETRSSPRASPGTGSRDPMKIFVHALLLAGLAAAGCAPDFKDGLGPRVPTGNVEGIAERDGTPAASLDVSVRNPTNDASIGSARSDANGFYAIAAPPGQWELKIKGKMAGDFDSVSRPFVVQGPEERISLEPLDVFAYGAATQAPSDGAL